MSRPYDELMEKAECNQYALAEKIYQLGRADQKKEDNEFFNFEGAWELEKQKIRADVIAEFKDLGKLYSEIREEAYKEFAEVIAMDIASCKNCPIGCKDNSYGECEKRLVQYVKAMRGEEEND